MDIHGLLGDEVLDVPSLVVNFSRSSSRGDAGRVAALGLGVLLVRSADRDQRTRREIRGSSSGDLELTRFIEVAHEIRECGVSCHREPLCTVAVSAVWSGRIYPHD